jgi:hypothetical protein
MICFCIYSLLAMIIFLSGFIAGLKYSKTEIIKWRNLSAKYMDMFKIGIKWIKDNEKVEEFLKSNNYKSVGIYGMSYLGDCLQHILRKNSINILFGIDRNSKGLYNPYIPIYNVEDDLPYVDIIIVTAMVDLEEIRTSLNRKINRETKIILLEDILYS